MVAKVVCLIHSNTTNSNIQTSCLRWSKAALYEIGTGLCRASRRHTSAPPSRTRAMSVPTEHSSDMIIVLFTLFMDVFGHFRIVPRMTFVKTTKTFVCYIPNPLHPHAINSHSSDSLQQIRVFFSTIASMFVDFSRFLRYKFKLQIIYVI